MREMAESYRSLPIVLRAAIGGGLLLVAIMLLANIPDILGEFLAVGMLLFLMGLMLAMLGFFCLPFISFGLALYGLARAFRPSVPPAVWVPAHLPVEPPPWPAPATVHFSHPSPDELPFGIAAQVARVRDKAGALRSPDQAAFLGVEDRQQIDRTLNQYLPSCVATYRALPRGSADQPVEAGGMTANQLVESQLRLLEEGLDRIAQHVFQAGAAQLVAQQRFLEERFRQPAQG